METVLVIFGVVFVIALLIDSHRYSKLTNEDKVKKIMEIRKGKKSD